MSMRGTIRFNLVAGVIGLVVTFLLSFSNNLFLTSLMRAATAFVIWFLLAFALRWVLTFVTTEHHDVHLGVDDINLTSDERGKQLDLTTPDETDELNDLLKPKPVQSNELQEFTRLDPPKLVSTKDPEELAKAVRHLTEK